MEDKSKSEIGVSESQLNNMLETKFMEHEAREAENIKSAIDAFKSEAFPDGADRHKQAHQAMIDAARTQEEFWRGLRSDIAKKSIWGILQILLVLATAGLAAKLGFVAAIGK